MTAATKQVSGKIIEYLNEELSYPSAHMEGALKLLINGATLPFVARYRKEATGGLDETELKEVLHRYQYFEDLEDRKSTVLNTIEKQGKLTDELRDEIEACKEKNRLEDLYAPYKPKRRTRAQKAREKGLEPLADRIWLQPENAPDLHELAEELLPEEVETVEEALEGAHDILAERIADNPDIRQWLRTRMYKHGMLTARAKKDWQDQPSKFEMYYDYQEPVKSLPGHRFLAIRRGAGEDVLNYGIDVETEPVFNFIAQRIITTESPYRDFLDEVIQDAFHRLLSVSIAGGILAELREKAEEEAIQVFAQNVADVLMAPGAGPKRILAIDPGFRTGCKTAVIDETGKFLASATIYPHPPQNSREDAEKVVEDLLRKYDIDLVAVGNGTAGRETLGFVTELMRQNNRSATPVLVNESGASVYSASDLAAEEFPDLDVTVRGAISIGRRLQDPLSELVKIDPKSIGVGQYQHDVNQTRLKGELDTVVSSCVNAVGVDINTASRELLQYVSGLNAGTAEAIVDHRESTGPFRDRQEIQEVPGIGEVTFEQCAGFLKIPGGRNPLDNSNVHPESYYIVEEMIRQTNQSLQEVIGKGIEVDPGQFADDRVGLPTIRDILAELKRPGRDPRDEFKMASFKEGVEEIEDLREGMILEGTVTNITHFGVFVDIGVHQDGLVHISEIADKYVKDPHDEVRVGEIVKVKVLSIDVERKRIGLSMKQVSH
ncbi:MAG TPA: Tex family protein [bacterium]|nr:Tex family protein [bacterium]